MIKHSITFDYSKLLGRIIEIYGSHYKFAKQLGISTHSLSMRLNGHIAWRDVEIYKSIELLNLKADDIDKYFFKQKVK